jgi:hypothetical protein
VGATPPWYGKGVLLEIINNTPRVARVYYKYTICNPNLTYSEIKLLAHVDVVGTLPNHSMFFLFSLVQYSSLLLRVSQQQNFQIFQQIWKL